MTVLATDPDAGDEARDGRVCASPRDLVGATPLLRVTGPLAGAHPGFWAKLEGLGPAGMKARAALSVLDAARRRGDLAPGAPVVESTSGSLGLGLALACTALRHPLVVVADRELDGPTRTLLRARGVRLEIVETPHPTGGWQQARLDRVARVLATEPGAYWPDQYSNPDNPAGYAPMVAELAGQCASGPGTPRVLVCSVGTGGHSAGLAAGLRRRWPDLRVVGVDAPNSSVFGPDPGPRVMRGLGSSIHPDNVDYAVFDEVHWVGPAEAAQACRALARHTFVTGGWSTGAVALVSAHVARTRGDDRVLTVFPDGPERYASTIFDDAFCDRHGLFAAPATAPVDVASPPRRVPAGWTRCRSVADPCRARHAGTRHAGTRHDSARHDSARHDPARTGPCRVCGKEAA
ncbi:cysteine synthase A [Pseudonocardia sediminis]|uniref:Cysteine synthase A n=1 Tax=Pseudonocardia sediminis TaxID=1397368 RepID=A0A4Q7V007_PSEST|nr:PLP-dependent cysteine synthase family protein [Pseudonocardia sediminis]RZT87767.1 cysteine synthase A [Pseudonocardia sediminis]